MLIFLGAKLANIFSLSFQVETADGARSGKYFSQIYSENMSKKTDPVIRFFFFFFFISKLSPFSCIDSVFYFY